jgi:sugar phosphate isomerase/epimerase
LATYGKERGISILIENHVDGVSNNPDVIARLMKRVPGMGTLPDFGNFPKGTDRYEAIRKMMPFAKGVSAKVWDFTADFHETTTDMDRMMNIVLDSGYSGWVGIEYEGTRMPEYEGVAAAKKCLERYL